MTFYDFDPMILKTSFVHLLVIGDYHVKFGEEFLTSLKISDKQIVSRWPSLTFDPTTLKT